MLDQPLNYWSTALYTRCRLPQRPRPGWQLVLKQITTKLMIGIQPIKYWSRPPIQIRKNTDCRLHQCPRPQLILKQIPMSLAVGIRPVEYWSRPPIQTLTNQKQSLPAAPCAPTPLTCCLKSSNCVSLRTLKVLLASSLS